MNYDAVAKDILTLAGGPGNVENLTHCFTRLRLELSDRTKADKEKTKAGITGVEIAARIIKECKPYCQGVHIMALGWESKIPDLLKLAEI
jgi:5,10-methylenetetrahydrofolate reductase